MEKPTDIIQHAKKMGLKGRTLAGQCGELTKYDAGYDELGGAATYDKRMVGRVVSDDDSDVPEICDEDLLSIQEPHTEKETGPTEGSSGSGNETVQGWSDIENGCGQPPVRSECESVKDTESEPEGRLQIARPTKRRIKAELVPGAVAHPPKKRAKKDGKGAPKKSSVYQGIIFEKMQLDDRSRRWTMTMKGFSNNEMCEDLFGIMKEAPAANMLDLHMALHDSDSICDNMHIHVGAAFGFPMPLSGLLNKVFWSRDSKGKLPKKIWASPMNAQLKQHADYLQRGAIEFVDVLSSNRVDKCRRDDIDYIADANEFVDSNLNFDEWIYKKASVNSRYINETKQVKEAVKIVQKNRARHEVNKKIMSRDKMYAWQRWMDDILEKESDDRKVYVIVDPVGNSGKSSFGVSWCLKHAQEGIIVQNGKTADIVHGLSKEDESRLRTVFIDFSRSNEDHLNFDMIERIKNGYLFSTKYDSHVVQMARSLHVVLFVNQHIDYSKMSMDRWRIYEMETPDVNRKEKICVQLNNEVALEKYKEYRRLCAEEMYKQ